ncbi:selenocysteine-specific translation elongation factor [Paenibacillus glucanolyticus]|uniref:selenocysteine-specific translation elongation factor n=1 Tax=Paenibacillus glucanolyticus TaxID=59843 RepID=UPI0036A98445
MYYTIGIAGHINHGKTSLTKALTNIDTDRLKVEKERNISIELGYAQFSLYGIEASIIDVPGHEKFIKKMIAGVAGIDLVILVVAADEGVMPQTREHIEILTLLGIVNGLIVVTKIDRVEPEFLNMVVEDINKVVKGSIFEEVETLFVDNIRKTGIDELKLSLHEKLIEIPQRISNGALRLPIDQVFTIHGHGVVVRGTIYEGVVNKGDTLIVLPQQCSVKAKEVQIHNCSKDKASAGQRVAINIGGALKQRKIKRGDVIVTSTNFTLSTMVDVSLNSVNHLQYPVKQRTPIHFYCGTTESSGYIVFFDRNELREGSEVLCQIRLTNPIVVKRGDRFIIRRPSPSETIGGGWVIGTAGEKYRFGEETIQKLLQQREASSEERVLDVLSTKKCLDKNEISKSLSISCDQINEILNGMIDSDQIVEIEPGFFTSKEVYNDAGSQVKFEVHKYHELNPFRIGISKAECIQILERNFPKKLIEAVINKEIEKRTIAREQHIIYLTDFEPHIPKELVSKFDRVLDNLKHDRMEVKEWGEYCRSENVHSRFEHESYHFMITKKLGYPIGDKQLIHYETFDDQFKLLYHATKKQPFSLQDAREILSMPRKNLVKFLELLDFLQFTKRVKEIRKWTL